MTESNFDFVGGPQDGKSIAVPGTISPNTEFLVRPAEPYLPWSPYTLAEDGRFHYMGLNMGGGHPVPWPHYDEAGNLEESAQI